MGLNPTDACNGHDVDSIDIWPMITGTNTNQHQSHHHPKKNERKQTMHSDTTLRAHGETPHLYSNNNNLASQQLAAVHPRGNLLEPAAPGHAVLQIRPTVAGRDDLKAELGLDPGACRVLRPVP